MANNKVETQPKNAPKTEIDSKAVSPSDSTLILDFVHNKSPRAFETLVRRYYSQVHKRLLRLTKNSADADDLSQKLWLRVLENLCNYNDKQKFPNFLNTIATNLVKDEWRKSGVHKQSSLDEMLEVSPNDSFGQALLIDNNDTVDNIISRGEIDYLTKELIPNLDTKLRAVFLLRHESEYWDNKQPFQWQHLGELNKLTTEQAGQKFITARDALINKTDWSELSDEDTLIFLIWTQAQRQDKAAKQTETYLALLLNIPVNTFKTRYRAALAELSTSLEKWRQKTS